MLHFNSASVRIADSGRAVEECISIMYGDGTPEDGGIWIINAVIGHKLDKLAAAVKARLPGTTVLASSCGGVIGREGSGEAMTHLAVMAVNGPKEELGWAAVDGYSDENALEKGRELAAKLKASVPNAGIVYLLNPGINTCNDVFLNAFNEAYGETVVFGGTSSDNYKAVVTSQYIGDKASPLGAWAVGFADKSLKYSAKATHGFKAFGEPMTVTKAANNVILEMDGKPAWDAYREKLSLIPDDNARAFLVAGGLARTLDASLAKEYGSPHILRLGIPDTERNVIKANVAVKEGDQYYLTMRDEDLIFSEQKKALEILREDITKKSGDGKVRPAAVLQTDCLFRGRALFDRVMKDEIMGLLYNALSDSGDIPPWLGMYGFGEYCPLGGKNIFHTYTTSLLVLYR